MPGGGGTAVVCGTARLLWHCYDDDTAMFGEQCAVICRWHLMVQHRWCYGGASHDPEKDSRCNVIYMHMTAYCW